MAVDDDDVPEPVPHQPCEHRAHVGRISLGGNVRGAGISRQRARHAVGNVRRDEGVDLRRDCLRDLHRGEIIRAIINHTVRLERPRRQQHRLHLRGNELAEFHPVQVVHLARGNLLREAVRKPRACHHQPASKPQSSHHRPPPAAFYASTPDKASSSRALGPVLGTNRAGFIGTHSQSDSTPRTDNKSRRICNRFALHRAILAASLDRGRTSGASKRRQST